MSCANDPIAVMQRIELKYLMDAEQTRIVREGLRGHMAVDQYGLTSIASLYYDTPDHRLIRQSLEKPAFKEKIRLRSYGPATDTTPAFLELKRKAFSIVYKRRVQTTVPEAQRFMAGKADAPGDGQIDREIEYFRDLYGDLRPSCLIIYDRTAYFEPEGDLRLTIDAAPRYRMRDLELTKPYAGAPLLPEGWTILEIKVQDALPLWLSGLIDRAGVRKTSFSKYGEAYLQQLLRLQQNMRERKYAYV